MPSLPTISLLVVEDEPLVRADLTDCLQELGCRQIWEAGSTTQAKALLASHSFDLVLLDINLEKGTEGIELAKLINQEYLIPFVYLTAYSDDRTIQAVSDTLPAGFILKPFDEFRLKSAIEIALRTYYAVIQPHWRKTEDINQYLMEPLTRREMDLLHLICQGFTYQQMADQLVVSINTVKTHLKNLYLKLQVSTRAEAILKVQHIGQS